MAIGAVVVVLWFLALSAGTGAVLLLRRRSCVVRRYEAQRCIHCGYDIRASLGQCPECGSALLEQSVAYWKQRMKESSAR